MIKSDRGTVIVNGRGAEIIFECDHLIRALIKDNPEIISAVIYKNNDELAQAIVNSDEDKLQVIEDYIDHFQQVREELNNEE